MIERIWFSVALVVTVICLAYGGRLMAVNIPTAHAGSGEHQRTQACKALLNDHYVIANSRMQGMSQNELAIHAVFSPRLPDERRRPALALIPEAYAAEDVKAWFIIHWDKCMSERETERET